LRSKDFTAKQSFQIEDLGCSSLNLNLDAELAATHTGELYRL